METSLYAPVKQFLENLGFHVKGEIGGCDLVGIAEGSPPVVVIGELKLAFNLDLVLQGVDRADVCDEVWLAVRASRRNGRERDARVRKLCRRLGFGLLAVSEAGTVDIIARPEGVMPRRNLRRRSRVVEEHTRRQDPDRSAASITTTPREEPEMIRFRRGKSWERAMKPGWHSLTSTPFSVISVARLLCSGG